MTSKDDLPSMTDDADINQIPSGQGTGVSERSIIIKFAEMPSRTEYSLVDRKQAHGLGLDCGERSF